jgi:hypothetical protein
MDEDHNTIDKDDTLMHEDKIWWDDYNMGVEFQGRELQYYNMRDEFCSIMEE